MQRIGPRVEEIRQALHAIRRRDQDRRQRDRQQHREAEEQSPVEPAEKQDPEGDREDHDERAEVGLEQQQAADQHHHGGKRREPAQQRLPQRLLGVQERGLAHRVARRVEHRGELHEFGRLDVDDDERKPALRAVDRLADAGDQHEHEQRGAGDEEPRRAALPDPDRHLEREECCEEPDRQERRVPREEIPRAISGVGGRLGGCDRRRIHHHQAERDQQQRRPRERHVEGQHRARLARQWPQRRLAQRRAGGEALTHRRRPRSAA